MTGPVVFNDALQRSVGQRPRRPESVRRLTIDDVAARRGVEFGFRDHIVPWDLARPGDVQIAVPSLVGSTRSTGVRSQGSEMRVPVEAANAPWVSLELLSGELSTAKSVVVCGRVSATQPLPNVKEVIVLEGGRVAPDTWKHLVGLERLAVHSTAALDLCEVSTTLDELVVTWRVESPQSWFDDLPRLTNLQRIFLPYVSHSLAPLVRLPALRDLRFAGGKQLSRLGHLESLERVEMHEVKLESLKAFRRWERVQKLSIGTVKDLGGIEALRSLEDLDLYGRKLPQDLTPLAKLPRLRALKLITLEKTRDFGGLRGVTGLTRLHVSAGSTSDGIIEDHDFVRDMKDLQEFWVGGRVRRARIAPLLGKKLTEAHVCGDFGPDAERVREVFSGPGMHISSISVGPLRELEPQHAEAEGRPFWYVNEDLTEEFDAEDNHEVGKAVRAEIQRRAPDLSSKLEFDSEAVLLRPGGRGSLDPGSRRDHSSHDCGPAQAVTERSPRRCASAAPRDRPRRQPLRLVAVRALYARLDEHASELLAGTPGGLVDDAGRTHAAIGEELPVREPSLASMALRLRTSSRTVQRRLEEEGTSFAAQVDQVRRERAEAFVLARLT
jgi:AraC-like DNA-binding protein